MLKPLFNSLVIAAAALTVAPMAAADERIDTITADLRQTRSGEALHQFSLSQKANVTWSSKHAGTQHFDQVTINPNFDHPAAVQILAHELRHVWQAYALKTANHRLSPMGRFRLQRMREVDACAYESHLAAERADLFGNKLAATTTYNDNMMIAIDYAAKPKAKRDYLKHAILPCAAKVSGNDHYNTFHYSAAFDVLRDARQTDGILKNPAIDNNTLSFFYDNVFKLTTPDDTRALFKSFFTHSLDPRDTIPAIKRMSDAQFDTLIEKITAPKTHFLELGLIEAEFVSLKARTEKRLSIAQP